MPENEQIAELILRADLENAGDTATIVQIAQQAVLPRQLVDGALYAVIGSDGVTRTLETPGYAKSQASTPRRVERAVTVGDAESFIHYIDANTEQDNTTALFTEGSLEVWADIDNDRVTAIVDGGHGWRRHTCTLALTHSQEWVDWNELDGQLLTQTVFAEFVEDHLSTIAAPDGAKLVDICQTLQAHTNVQFRQQSILANGQRQFRYEETTEAKAGQRGDLTIPGELLLALRPFTGSNPVPVKARFRFRITDGALRLGVRLTEPVRVLEDAFSQIVDEISGDVNVPVLFGCP